jgi:hypothetical protein
MGKTGLGIGDYWMRTSGFVRGILFQIARLGVFFTDRLDESEKHPAK